MKFPPALNPVSSSQIEDRHRLVMPLTSSEEDSCDKQYLLRGGEPGAAVSTSKHKLGRPWPERQTFAEDFTLEHTLNGPHVSSTEPSGCF